VSLPTQPEKTTTHKKLTHRHSDRLSHPESAPHAVAASLELLCALPVPTEAHDFCNNTLSKKPRAHQSSTTHKNRAQAAWLALFACALTKAQKKTLLNLTTHLIVPWFTKPELLMDFLTDSFNTGGATSLLALAGLFHLMQAKNLDYPSFYTKLYSLLDAAVLHSKHRSRFLRQLNVFLSSTHLPAALVASFLKRLARLALHAPPAAVVAVVPWSYNMLRAHPACTFMLHRDAVLADEDEVVADPFDMREQDPMETQALDSCLWELDALRRHYHPNVASVAGIVAQQFTKLSYNLEDFLDHSYGSVSFLVFFPPCNLSFIGELTQSSCSRRNSAKTSRRRRWWSSRFRNASSRCRASSGRRRGPACWRR